MMRLLIAAIYRQLGLPELPEGPVTLQVVGDLLQVVPMDDRYDSCVESHRSTDTVWAIGPDGKVTRLQTGENFSSGDGRSWSETVPSVGAQLIEGGLLPDLLVRERIDGQISVEVCPVKGHDLHAVVRAAARTLHEKIDSAERRKTIARLVAAGSAEIVPMDGGGHGLISEEMGEGEGPYPISREEADFAVRLGATRVIAPCGADLGPAD